jgi:hypothetical protein
MKSEMCIRGHLLAPCATERCVSPNWQGRTLPPILRATHSSLLLKVIAGVFSVAPLLVAAETDLHDYASSFTFENDLFFKTDKYYTDGVQLTVKGRMDERSERTKNLLKTACSFANCESDAFQLSQTRIGQLMYTPVDISNPAPQPLDRPWAGMLYAANDYHFLSDDDRRLTTITSQLGVIGPLSYADRTQTWIHKTFNNRTPEGWSNQIGGELGLLASVEKRFAINPPAPGSVDSGVQVRPVGHWRLVAGNIMTYVGAGLTVAVGKNLPLVFPRESGDIPSIFRPARYNSADQGSKTIDTSCIFQWLSCTAFATFEARLVAWNVFLDGGMFREDPHVTKNPMVADASFGVRLDFPKTRNTVTGPWFAQFKATIRSPEFQSSMPVSSQSFGALTVGTEF